MTRSNALHLVSELRDSLAALYGERLEQVLLYGSHARDEGTEESDIDVAVVLKGPVNQCEEIRRSNPIAADLSLEHNCLLSCFFLTSEDLNSGLIGIHRSIASEGVPV